MKTCDEVRDLLPLALAGEETAVREHLAACAACRAEWHELEALGRRLDAVPAPPAQPIDLAAIYAAADDRHVHSVRRWRRAAVVAAALAAGVLFVAVLPRLEVRLGGNELALRWGPAEPPPPAPTTVDPVLLARVERPGSSGAGTG